jgi:hypothetical protein
MRGKRFCVRYLEARETEDIPLVKQTPMVLEMHHYDLTNRVCCDAVCMDRAAEQRPQDVNARPGGQEEGQS